MALCNIAPKPIYKQDRCPIKISLSLGNAVLQKIIHWIILAIFVFLLWQRNISYCFHEGELGIWIAMSISFNVSNKTVPKIKETNFPLHFFVRVSVHVLSELQQKLMRSLSVWDPKRTLFVAAAAVCYYPSSDWLAFHAVSSCRNGNFQS